MKIIFLLLLCVFSLKSFAQNLMYPELQVTPRASDRLSIEEKLEQKNDWVASIPMQIPAVATFLAGIKYSSADVDQGLTGDDKKKEEAKRDMLSTLAMGVGAGWIGLNIWQTVFYKPYAKSLSRIRSIKAKGKRGILTRERLSEEEINSLRLMGKRMRWVSFISNFVVNGALTSVKLEEEEDSPSIYAGLGALASFVPLFFSSHWERVADEQEKYKKRVFGPVAYSPILFDPFKGSKATGFNLSMRF